MLRYVATSKTHFKVWDCNCWWRTESSNVKWWHRVKQYICVWFVSSSTSEKEVYFLIVNPQCFGKGKKVKTFKDLLIPRLLAAANICTFWLKKLFIFLQKCIKCQVWRVCMLFVLCVVCSGQKSLSNTEVLRGFL